MTGGEPRAGGRDGAGKLAPSSPAPPQELARDLGVLEAYTIGVGTMIGAGIFVLPSIAAGNAGPASAVSFAIGGVVSLLAALSLSELATGMPRAGGSYYYVNRALGAFFGSVVGWGMWAGLMFATAFYMLGFGQYLTYFHGEIPVALAALAMAALLLAVNYRGVKETGTLQNVIVVALLGFIVVFVAFGVFRVDWQVLRPFNPYGWGAVAGTAATVYVSFIGFEVIATSAEEIKDPGRNLPLAMIASVLTPTALYVLVILVCTGVVPLERLVASRIPVAEAASVFLGPLGALLMVGGAVLATVSSANASILSAARVNFAMGRDRILSDWLNDVHGRYRTPYRAILVTGGVILVLIALGVGLETLADVASFSYLVTYALVHVSVIVMRRAAPADYRPSFRLPGPLYPWVPALGLVSCVVILASMRPLVLLAGAGILLVGIVWYFGYAASRAVKPSLIGEAIVAPGSRPVPPKGAYRIVVPVANPDTEAALLRLAAAVAAEHEGAELVAVNVIEVPPQTALDQELRFEEERIDVQRRLLAAARDFARSQRIRLRTRALLGRDVADTITTILTQERADQVLLGWSGERSRAGHILGTNIDRIVRRATCEVTLVKLGPRRGGHGRAVALVGKGPNAPLAVRCAAAFARGDGASLTLLHVQEVRDGEDAGEAPREVGLGLIATTAEKAGLRRGEYDARVALDEQVVDRLLEEIAEFDLVCVGATRSTALARALFGSIPERIGAESDATVAIVRGVREEPRTVVEALVERLTGG